MKRGIKDGGDKREKSDIRGIMDKRDISEISEIRGSDIKDYKYLKRLMGI